MGYMAVDFVRDFFLKKEEVMNASILSFISGAEWRENENLTLTNFIIYITTKLKLREKSE